MGSYVSRWLQKQTLNSANATSFIVRLNGKETAERLKALHARIRYSDKQLSILLCSVESGIILEKQLIKMNQEIGYTACELEKLDNERRSCLGEEIAAWEDLMGQLTQHLQQLRNAQDYRSQPDHSKSIEMTQIAARIMERAEALRQLRCQVVAELEDKCQPAIKTTWVSCVEWLDWLSLCEVRRKWRRVVEEKRRQSEEKERQGRLKEVEEMAVKFYPF